MCACVHCVYAYMCVCCVCVIMCMYMHMCVCNCVHVGMCICICTYGMCAYEYICAYMSMYVHSSTYFYCSLQQNLRLQRMHPIRLRNQTASCTPVFDAVRPGGGCRELLLKQREIHSLCCQWKVNLVVPRTVPLWWLLNNEICSFPSVVWSSPSILLCNLI